jgi:hypothetical protein
MPVGIEEWIIQIPPITRGWLALAVLTSLAVVSGVFSDLEIIIQSFLAMPVGGTFAAVFQLPQCVHERSGM